MTREIAPEDSQPWKQGALADIAEFANGKPYENFIEPNGKNLLITLDSVDIYGELKSQHKRTNVEDNSLKEGDIVTVLSDLAHGYLLGLSAVIPKEGCYVLNQRMGRLRTKETVSAAFLRLWINAHQSHFRNRGQGTSQRHIYKRDFYSLEVKVPPLKEQQAIVNAVADTNNLIKSLDLLIAKKRDIKQGAMQQLLSGKTRLPGFSKMWVQSELGQVAQIKTGGKNNQDKTEGGKYPFFVRSATVERSDTYSYESEAVLIPGEGGIGSIFHYVQGKHEVHQRVYRISDFTESTSGKFIYYYLQQFFGIHAARNSVKATVDSLRLPTFTHFELNTPDSVQEQQAIAEVLSEMDAEIDALVARRKKTALIKSGVIQQLLTGRTRLL